MMITRSCYSDVSWQTTAGFALQKQREALQSLRDKSTKSRFTRLTAHHRPHCVSTHNWHRAYSTAFSEALMSILMSVSLSLSVHMSVMSVSPLWSSHPEDLVCSDLVPACHQPQEAPPSSSFWSVLFFLLYPLSLLLPPPVPPSLPHLSTLLLHLVSLCSDLLLCVSGPELQVISISAEFPVIWGSVLMPWFWAQMQDSVIRRPQREDILPLFSWHRHRV